MNDRFVDQISRFVISCGANLPGWLVMRRSCGSTDKPVKLEYGHTRLGVTSTWVLGYIPRYRLPIALEALSCLTFRLLEALKYLK